MDTTQQATTYVHTLVGMLQDPDDPIRKAAAALTGNRDGIRDLAKELTEAADVADAADEQAAKELAKPEESAKAEEPEA